MRNQQIAIATLAAVAVALALAWLSSHRLGALALLIASGGVGAVALVFAAAQVRSRSRSIHAARDCEDRAASLALAKAQLVVALDAARAAETAKAAFVESASHELRTPLHAILGGAQALIQYGNLTSADAQMVRTMAAEGQRLLQLVNKLLHVSDGGDRVGRIRTSSGGIDVTALRFADDFDTTHTSASLRHTGSVPCTSLVCVPHELAAEIERAASLGDFFLVTELLSQLAAHDEGLAERLHRYVSIFDYDGMTASLRRAVARRDQVAAASHTW